MADKRYVLKSPNLIVQPSDEGDLWNADWIISMRKGEMQSIGTLSFAGEKARGTVPLWIELEEEYRDKGYGTEAIRLIVNWIFRYPNVYEVKAETVHENYKCVKALNKAGFVFRGSEGHTERYSIIKGKSSWTGIYLAIGIFLGIALGIVLDHQLLGMCLGLAVCLAVGISMDVKEKKQREDVVGRKEK